ncbi:MAG: hypothetical protein PHG06_23350 [Parabacteroides sp.]|nr:hypothetical protein [Parabacteroides sp.]
MIVPVTTENEKAWADLCVALWSDESTENMLQQRAMGELPNEFLYFIDADNDNAAAFLSLS